MEETTIFREFIGDNPTTRILEFLIEGKDFDYSLTDIANNSGVSWRTVHRIFPRFIKNNIVVKTRMIGRATLPFRGSSWFRRSLRQQLRFWSRQMCSSMLCRLPTRTRPIVGFRRWCSRQRWFVRSGGFSLVPIEWLRLKKVSPSRFTAWQRPGWLWVRCLTPKARRLRRSKRTRLGVIRNRILPVRLRKRPSTWWRKFIVLRKLTDLKPFPEVGKGLFL